MTPSLYPHEPLLIIDDEADTLKSYELTLKSEGINNVLSCRDPRKAMSIIADRNLSVILLDLSMPFISGEEILLNITNEHPDISVIIITGDNEVDTAVRCMKRGAFDYMVKPVEKNRLVSGVNRVIEFRSLQRENLMLKQRILDDKLARPGAFSGIITNNRTMLSLFQYAESIAISPKPVLITGETGVGKDLMARAIHTLSERPGEFISINAAGIDDNVFADTLFGHVKGAFTGADQARKGIIEQASGGTMVLEEIGDLNIESQVKLLRVIQEGEYYPLGSDLPQKSDARIIVNTNRDLQTLQDSERFRQDLFFRLRTHHIHIPPLRERTDDIPLLLEHFLGEIAQSLKKRTPSYPEQLTTLLSNYSFPGNIRELRVMVYDALSTHKSKILSMKRFLLNMDQGYEHTGLDSTIDQSEQSPTLQITGALPTLKQATRSLISEAMRRADNNQSMAARLLGISRQTLARHLNSETR